MDGDPDELARTLKASAAGDPTAAERLFPIVYDRLRALAASYMKNERPSHTLQPTAVVHEAYVRMAGVNRTEWRSTSHFLAVTARHMRRVLVEHARGIKARKRGGGAVRVTLDETMAVDSGRPVELLAIDEALANLAGEHARAARVAEMRLFAGMEVTEIAAALEVSERTVKGDWQLAKGWLARALGLPAPEDD